MMKLALVGLFPNVRKVSAQSSKAQSGELRSKHGQMQIFWAGGPGVAATAVELRFHCLA